MLRCSITQKPKPTDLTYVDKHISAKIRIQTKLYRHHKQLRQSKLLKKRKTKHTRSTKIGERKHIHR